jgi:hypothetical protein
VKYELGVDIPEDDILHGHRREDLKSYFAKNVPLSSNIELCGETAGCQATKTQLQFALF